MQIPRAELSQLDRVLVQPGEHAVAGGEVVLSTLLGSCVAACLYDPINKVVGMNHFLLASRRYVPDPSSILSEPGRYGVLAMELLINDMLKLGAVKRNLQAKVFGGGKVLGALNKKNRFSNVGEVNGRFVREFLEQERIPLVAARLGGENGVMIHFFSSDYSVYLRKIGQNQITKVTAQERLLRAKYIDKQSATSHDAELWDAGF